MGACNVCELIIRIGKGQTAECDILHAVGGGASRDIYKSLGYGSFNVGGGHILAAPRVVVQSLGSLVKVELALAVHKGKGIVYGMCASCGEPCSPARSLGNSTVGLLHEEYHAAAVIFYITGTNYILVPCGAVHHFKVVEIGGDTGHIACSVDYAVALFSRVPRPVCLTCGDVIVSVAALSLHGNAAHISAAVIDIEVPELYITVERSHPQLVVIFGPACDLYRSVDDGRLSFASLISYGKSACSRVPCVEVHRLGDTVVSASEPYHDITCHAAVYGSDSIPRPFEGSEWSALRAVRAVISVGRYIENSLYPVICGNSPHKCSRIRSREHCSRRSEHCGSFFQCHKYSSFNYYSPYFCCRFVHDSYFICYIFIIIKQAAQ